MKSDKLHDQIELVKWQIHPKQHYPLLTIHSLLLDDNSRFQHLKQLIHNYNEQTNPQRIRLQQKFIGQLFNMMNQLVRLPTTQQMNEYLEGIWKWASQEEPDQKRPTTATTRNKTYSSGTRPLSGYTQGRPVSGITRPMSGIKRPVSGINQPVSGHTNTRPMSAYNKAPLQIVDWIEQKMDKTNTKIDYTRLKDGQKQFYAGIRTIHKEYQHPKKLLKEYRRKVYYEENDDSDVEIIEVDPQPQFMPQVALVQQIEEPEQQGQGEGQGEGEAQGQAVNIDDIPIQGQPAQAGQPQAEEQPKQVIDKLKPRIKNYAPNKKQDQYNHQKYQGGQMTTYARAMQRQVKVDEDQQFALFQTKQAQYKGRVKSEHQRRAESARMLTKIVGMPVKQPKEQNQQNVINLDSVDPAQVNTKGWRPSTAFVATNPAKRQQLIKNAFMSGNVKAHVNEYVPPSTSQSIPSKFDIVGKSLAVGAQNPKKKTFEEILRYAQQRVAQQAEQQVLDVKQTFAKNKISLNANKIMKSITYYEKDMHGDQFAGQITGLNMTKNPFIKVTKKKNKKKKKP